MHGQVFIWAGVWMRSVMDGIHWLFSKNALNTYLWCTLWHLYDSLERSSIWSVTYSFDSSVNYWIPWYRRLFPRLNHCWRMYLERNWWFYNKKWLSTPSESYATYIILRWGEWPDNYGFLIKMVKNIKQHFKIVQLCSTPAKSLEGTDDWTLLERVNNLRYHLLF